VRVVVVQSGGPALGLVVDLALEEGCEVLTATGLPSAGASQPALVFVSCPAGDQQARFLDELEALVGTSPRTAVVILAEASQLRTALQTRSRGAKQVLLSPPEPEEVRAVIAAHGDVESIFTSADERLFLEIAGESLVGANERFRRSLLQLRKAAKSDANVLILGETGTGKEMFAQALHRMSRRGNRRFLALNIAAVDRGIWGSELFGHVRGSYTGAAGDRIGRLEAAGDGTFLLDEIGELDPGLQTTLLRVIELRVFERLGSNDPIPFKARLVCATNKDLDRAVEEGSFRGDLLRRIEHYRIVLPPLRERMDDVPTLVRHFLSKHGKDRFIQAGPSAMEYLLGYSYPGNVRELESAMITAIANSNPREWILPEDLPDQITSPSPEDLHEHLIRIPKATPYAKARDEVLRIVDAIYLKDYLRQSGDNISKAAERAGIDRKTFQARLHSTGQGEEKSHE
jgi:DNA-binding NtrC family response regulator